MQYWTLTGQNAILRRNEATRASPFGQPMRQPSRELRAKDMLGFLKTIFTWWNHATVGTLWFTRRRGVLVGDDENGNKYYEEKVASGESGQKRRWIIYNGTVEASRIPADWHGWLHYTFDEPPTKAPFKLKEWEKPHKPNLTGTPNAYHPAGSLWNQGARAKTSSDYEAWSPE